MNIILQHFAGTMPKWGIEAEKTMRKYAHATGAEYELVLDFPMGEELGFTPQKLCMLQEKYDKYDQVCMIDMDTIATPEHESFWDRPEIGVLHDRAMGGHNALNAVTGEPHRSRTYNAAPALYKEGAHIFFGNWIKLNREQRVELRKHWDHNLFVLSLKDKHPGDEIILHYLLHRSGILDGKTVKEICMRCEGDDLSKLKFRDHDRHDKKFCNQPEDSLPNASIMHFCAGRKRNIIPTIRQMYPEGI